MGIAHSDGYVEFVAEFTDPGTEFINGQVIYVTDQRMFHVVSLH
jgi:hypothetical protein